VGSTQGSRCGKARGAFSLERRLLPSVSTHPRRPEHGGRPSFISGGTTRAGGKRHPIAFDNPPHDILTQRFQVCCSEQMPASFKMSPLPKEISSWVLSALRIAVSCLTAESRKATSLTAEPGSDGSDSAPKPEEVLTLTSDVNFSSDPSLSAFAPPNGKREAEKSMESAKGQWLRTLCAKPQATGLRRFGATCNQAPCTSRAQLSCSLPPAPSSEPLPMPTRHPTDNEQSLQDCCETGTS
jgi:hypothetical protein